MIPNILREISWGVVASVLDYDIVVRKFSLQPRFAFAVLLLAGGGGIREIKSFLKWIL